MKKLMKKLYQAFAPEFLKLRVNVYRHKRLVFSNKDFECVFVHIPKTAGTSLQKTLFNFAHTGHFRWDEYRAMNRKKFDNYYKFAFVRNPWDRVVSAYFYLNNGGGNEIDKKWSESVLAKYASFDEFVLNWLTLDNVKTWNHFVPQAEFIFDDKDHMRVDFCGRFENINEDFLVVSNKLGSERKLKDLNKSSRGNYAQYYTAETKAVVAKVYERDIRLLGYSFEG
ncbi:MAG: sulfotransferase family 2 domain-containing protein [Colwellia sp.]|jgi:Sulfotransferase family.